MSEIPTPINPSAEIKEQIITLSETQKESLTDSLRDRVRKAIKEIQEKVKIITEKPKLKGLIESKNYAEVFSLIDSYPEDVRKIILKKIYPGIITFSSNNSSEGKEIDRRNAELFVRNYKYFEESDTEVSMGVKEKSSYRKLLTNNPDLLLDNSQMLLTKEDSQGNKVISTNETTKVISKLIETKNIKCLIRNLDVIFNLQENSKGDDLLLINVKIDKLANIILNTDENLIQEELSKCSNEVKEIYSTKFEKNYFKKEYIGKSIIGAKEKLDKFQTPEEKEKYEKAIAGLEYLYNFEENVTAHCEKMFLKYGIFEEKMKDHMLEKINQFMNKKVSGGFLHSSLERLANKQNLEYLEYIGFLQQKLNEMIEEMCFYSYKQSNAVMSIIKPESGAPSRFTSQIEITEKQFNVTNGRGSNANTMKYMENTLFGDDFHSKSRGNNNCTYGYLNHSEMPHSKGGADFMSNDGGYGKFALRLDNSVRERTTIFLGDSSMGSRSGLATFAEIPHISVLLSQYNSVEDTEEIDLGINRDFMQRSPLTKGFTYFESQYHGQTGSTDQIEYVLYSELNTTREEIQHINRIISDLNEEEDEKEGGGHKIKLMRFSDYARKKEEEINE